jgi:mono/diheme cytochrome c family protein
MTFRILSAAVLAAWAVAAVHVIGAEPVIGAEEQAAPTMNDGIYTDAQAKRGAEVYKTICANCHGATGQGGEMAPALAGKDFLTNWVNQTMADLFVKVHEEMPQDNPGTLKPEQAADSIAFVLSLNKYPAGKAELSKDKTALKAIKIAAPK